MPRVRVHQHVNPFAPFYRFTPEAFVVEDVFADASKPLFLDLGCARGRFLLKMAALDPSHNYLGVEIREPLVREGNRLAEERGLSAHLKFEFCNAMLALGEFMAKIPDGVLQTVTIQFPDPWFKKKHAKRRMVNEELVATVVKHLAPGGRIFVQTDIEFLADEMFVLFRAREELTETKVEENPLPVKTERENAVEEKNLPVYRTMFLKST